MEKNQTQNVDHFMFEKQKEEVNAYYILPIMLDKSVENKEGID